MGPLQWPSFLLQKQGNLLCNQGGFYDAIPDKSSLHLTDLVTDTKMRSLKYVLLQRLITDLLSIFAYIFFAILCCNGLISVGNVAKYVSCVLLLVGSNSEIILQLQSLIDNNKYLKNYFKYLNVPPAVRKGLLPIDSNNAKEVTFDKVSFKYPGAQKNALRNFSYRFVKGKRIAVVGMNGSGKTTMIKLMPPL